MRANHIPRAARLERRVRQLTYRKDAHHVKSPHRGNPYWCCKSCGIHDPSLSIANGRHHAGCAIQGIDKEIAYYRHLLLEASSPAPLTPAPSSPEKV